MRLILPLIALLLYSVALSDDIHLRNGRIWKNVQIIDTTASIVTFRTANNDTVRLSNGDIVSIVHQQFFFGTPTVLETNASPSTTPSVKLRSIFLVPVAILALALSLDYFFEASDIDKTISDYDKLHRDTSSLRSTKSRKTTIAFVSLFAGIGTTYFALQSDDPSEPRDSTLTMPSH